MIRRAKRINEISKQLAKEAYRSYAGKKDYKRALEIYALLATSECVPKEIANYSKTMMARLEKSFKDKI